MHARAYLDIFSGSDKAQVCHQIAFALQDLMVLGGHHCRLQRTAQPTTASPSLLKQLAFNAAMASETTASCLRSQLIGECRAPCNPDGAACCMQQPTCITLSSSIKAEVYHGGAAAEHDLMILGGLSSPAGQTKRFQCIACLHARHECCKTAFKPPDKLHLMYCV